MGLLDRLRSGLGKISTPRGEGRSMTSLSSAMAPYDVRMSSTGQSYTGSDWFGPLPPLRPIAPPEVAGRSWDFIPGYNLTTQPRAYEPVEFRTLRMLAESYDPLHLVIERRKDQMVRLPWMIRVKHDASTKKKRPSVADLPAEQQQRIADITQFFNRPDREHTFRGWMRALLDDLFVIDAPTLWCERNRRGDLIGLRHIDGSTIKRVIDDWGRTPEPIIWDGEPFEWLGQLVTPDNFAALGFKLVDGTTVAAQLPVGVPVPDSVLLAPAYQQVLKGLPAVNYTTNDLFYRPSNLRPGRVYGYSPVEQVMTTVNIAMRRAMHQLEYYREGNQPEGIFGLPESWTPDQVQRFQDYWDNLFVGHLGKRRQMKFVPAGSKSSYVPFKEPPLKNEMDEWLIRIICFAFSYPPNAFVMLSNRSIADQHEKQSEEEGLEPTKQWATELFNDIVTYEFDSPDLEFAYVEEDEIDQGKQAEILTSYQESGNLTINQVRERLGEEPDADPAANQLMVMTTVGLVPIGANTLDAKIETTKAMQALMPEPEPNSTEGGPPKPAASKPEKEST